MAIRIYSENRNKRKRIDLARVNRIARIVLEEELRKKDVEINIIFLSSQKIRILNKLYLGKNEATDVIAFPRGKRYPVISAGADGAGFLGDIAISSDRAARNAKVFGQSYNDEVELCVIHGVLHLLGYSDTQKKDRSIMRRRQDEFFAKTRGHI